MRFLSRSVFLLRGLGIILLCFGARADQIIYNDSLQNGWLDWSWAVVNKANTAPVHSGTDSISVTCSNWSALYLDVAAMSVNGYTNLSFWINGGSKGGQQVQVQAILGSSSQTGVEIGPLPTNSWKQINLSTDALGITGAGNFTGFWIQCETNGALPTFYVDDIVLQSGTLPVTTNSTVTVNVDARANRHAISPLIYGVAFATSNQLSDLNFTMNRSGGNSETRYNWQLNAHNLGNDWYFESYPESDSTPGGAADDHVANSFAGCAQPLITIPIIGWMPKLGNNRGVIPSYSIAKYGAQTAADPWNLDAGNGVSSATGNAITNNDPNDANFPTNSLFQKGYVQHLIGRWGNSTNGGVRYYIMDNEHSLWSSTHRDVHPVGPTMQEIWSNMLACASMVKSNDPNALIVGPEEWGWSGYFYSGYDQQWSGQNNDYNPADYPDRTKNGGWDYMPWLLNQFHQHDTATGVRLLDYFTLHCYPQEGSVGSDATDNATDLLRNQTTRQFWDTNYVDPSWINSTIMLIPRMKSWVTNYYPGTKIGITEYNWGAESDMNGATAQADILGIFGREGLDLATRWTTPATNTPTYTAMKMYRNYDGTKSAFGDISVSATVPNPDNLSAFASVRTNDSALTVMVINKTLSGVTPMILTVTNFANSGVAQVWQLNSLTNAIVRLPDVAYTNGVVSNTLPAMSVTLFVLPTAKNLRFRVGTNAPLHQMELWLDGQGGQSYFIQSSTNLTTWSAISTNVLATNSLLLLVGTTNPGRMFYRGVLNAP